MTSEEDLNKDEIRTVGGKEFRFARWDLWLSIGQALRRGARLPDQDNPFIAGSDEAHLPGLSIVVVNLILAAFDPEWHNPRDVEDELGAIRSDLKDLKNRIASLDGHTLRHINNKGGPGIIYHSPLKTTVREDGTKYTEQILEFVPDEERTVPAALSAMERLETAIVSVIEEAIEASAKFKETGRIPNVAAHGVACVVAEYVRNVTGNLPGPRRKYSGSDFERTLVEIFELLKIKADAQAPAKAALLKLGKDG